ncbi:MAG TPA: hypothetical protein VGG69_07495 [Rhizomicrobium sp.]
MRKHLLTATAIATALTAGAAASADEYRVPTHAMALLTSTRISEIVHAQHVRSVGDPYLYNGRYLMRCYDRSGQLGYCTVDPYSGAFLGVHVTL